MTIYIFRKTLNEVKKQTRDVRLSDQTQKLQNQFNQVLMIQVGKPITYFNHQFKATIPLFVVVLPCVIGCGFTLLLINSGYLGSILMIALSWLPVLNSFATLVLLPPYRTLVIRFLTTGKLTLNKKIHASVMSSSKDSSVNYKPWDSLKDQRYLHG